MEVRPVSRSYPTLFAARLREGHGMAEAWLGAASLFTCPRIAWSPKKPRMWRAARALISWDSTT